MPKIPLGEFAGVVVTVILGVEKGDAKTEGLLVAVTDKFPKLEKGDFGVEFPPKIDELVSALVGVVNDEMENILPPDGAEYRIRK